MSAARAAADTHVYMTHRAARPPPPPLPRAAAAHPLLSRPRASLMRSSSATACTCARGGVRVPWREDTLPRWINPHRVSIPSELGHSVGRGQSFNGISGGVGQAQFLNVTGGGGSGECFPQTPWRDGARASGMSRSYLSRALMARWSHPSGRQRSRLSSCGRAAPPAGRAAPCAPRRALAQKRGEETLNDHRFPNDNGQNQEKKAPRGGGRRGAPPATSATPRAPPGSAAAPRPAWCASRCCRASPAPARAHHTVRLQRGAR